MEAITRTVTTEEITGYKAIDGAWFRTEEECRKYEESAKIVTYKMVEPYILAKTNCYMLFNGNGCEDDDVDIINIKDSDVLRNVNQWRVLCDKSVKILGDDCIGKTILLGWDYDRCWSWSFGTIDDVLQKIKEDYEAVINPKESEEK